MERRISLSSGEQLESRLSWMEIECHNNCCGSCMQLFNSSVPQLIPQEHGNCWCTVFWNKINKFMCPFIFTLKLRKAEERKKKHSMHLAVGKKD
jgi:hypothetical protein